jgi:hypothetical protein
VDCMVFATVNSAYSAFGNARTRRIPAAKGESLHQRFEGKKPREEVWSSSEFAANRRRDERARLLQLQLPPWWKRVSVRGREINRAASRGAVRRGCDSASAAPIRRRADRC